MRTDQREERHPGGAADAAEAVGVADLHRRRRRRRRCRRAFVAAAVGARPGESRVLLFRSRTTELFVHNKVFLDAKRLDHQKKRSVQPFILLMD